jgi:methionine-rich copper-binding protein CopC
MHSRLLRRGSAALAAVLLAACAGNGEGLNANGQPIGSGSNPGEPLTADFKSIQDNVFTPICVRCHSGASAPEGLQLDAAHSYALLVGVSSTEVPGLERVKSGEPDGSYIVLKLEGAPGIVGVQMPFGGPYLPQSTINVIRQWITNGAQPAATASSAAAFALAATSPPDQAHVRSSPAQLVVAFNHEIDFSLLNETTVVLERLGFEEAAVLPARLALAHGNPAAVLLTPASPLAPGSYRVRLRGTGAAALADVSGQMLGTDAAFEFTVDDSP